MKPQTQLFTFYASVRRLNDQNYLLTLVYHQLSLLESHTARPRWTLWHRPAAYLASFVYSSKLVFGVSSFQNLLNDGELGQVYYHILCTSKRNRSKSNCNIAQTKPLRPQRIILKRIHEESN